MSRQRIQVPTYRFHKQSGQAVADFHDPVTGRKRMVTLGKWQSPESMREHARLCAEVAVGRTSGPAAGLSVNEMFVAFLKHAAEHYRKPDGTPTSELANYMGLLKLVRETHGHIPAVEFGPLALKAVRQRMTGRWCRMETNKQTGRLKRIFKWAISEELIPGSVLEALKSVSGLQHGRTTARESAPILPVSEVVYDATTPYLPRLPRAVVGFMRWTGCRPGEACALRWCELDTSGDVWKYHPATHKTAHHGRGRTVAVGPRAKASLLDFLAGRTLAPAITFDPTDLADRIRPAGEYDRHHRPEDARLLRDVNTPVVIVAGSVLDPAAPLFDPRRDRAERFAEMRKNRVSKVTPSQLCRRKADPKRTPAYKYRPEVLHNAVERAAVAAGVDPWAPNQSRHLRATEARKQFGLEAAQVLLGHAKADVTQVYAERNEELAARVAGQVG